jgi:hypothetical protein
MWTYDLAREQAPTLDHLRRFFEVTREGGYNAIGLYLEHRFAFPSTPWAHGQGALTPEMVRVLLDEYPDIQIIPFVNLLGHMEGFLYTEPGSKFAEERFKGLQADPTNPDLVRLAEDIVDDTLAIFPSEIVHIGGDETWQLGVGEGSNAVVAEYELGGADGKAMLYGNHFGPLARRVVEAGRRPAVWGDMFFDHPTALDFMPTETLIFDWQYFRGPSETSALFREKGLDVVYCPAIHTYNATWLHLPQTEDNVREHAAAARQDGAFGVCVTTWELALFGNYETILPAIRACGRLLATDDPGPVSAHELPIDRDTDIAKLFDLREAPFCLRAYLEEGETHEEFARLMGIELLDAEGIFSFSGIRSAMKCRMLLYSNPFLFWLRNRDELLGEVGDRALDVLERAISVAPDSAYRGCAEFAKLSIEFVRHAEEARKLYAAGIPGEATNALIVCRQVFENLIRIAKATHLRIGGSAADVERCIAARNHVELVIRRVKEYGDGILGYLPSFETLTHPKFIPHDQGNWWLVNRWANE